MKEVLAPAPAVVDDTVTAKHLVDDVQVDVDPAAGAASVAAPSRPAASTQQSTRAMMVETGRAALGMAAPSSA
jgi:hypothetical protein